MGRVRQARREGVARANQWWNPLQRYTGSNLADVGRTAVHARPPYGNGRLCGRGSVPRPGGPGESLRRTRGEAAGE